MNKTQHGSATRFDPERADVVAYREARWSFRLPAPFDEVVRRYESLVPEYDQAALAELVRSGVAWDEVLADMRRRAPHDFVRYYTVLAGPLFALAGNDAPCNLYLMGNHTIAQRAFRHDPSVIITVPLRVVLHADSEEGAWFVIDQPSVRLASHGTVSQGRSEIAQVGEELDQKVGALLDLLRG